MRFLNLPFQTKRHFEMMKMQLAKRSIILMPWMFSQLLHSNTVSLKKRKMAFFEPPPRKESWENSSKLWLPTLQLLGSTHSWCFRVQTIFQMQQCKPSTISLGSQDLRKADVNMQRNRKRLRVINLGRQDWEDGGGQGKGSHAENDENTKSQSK